MSYSLIVLNPYFPGKSTIVTWITLFPVLYNYPIKHIPFLKYPMIHPQDVIPLHSIKSHETNIVSRKAPSNHHQSLIKSCFLVESVVFLVIFLISLPSLQVFARWNSIKSHKNHHKIMNWNPNQSISNPMESPWNPIQPPFCTSILHHTPPNLPSDPSARMPAAQFSVAGHCFGQSHWGAQNVADGTTRMGT